MQGLQLASHDYSIYLVSVVRDLFKVSTESKQNVSYDLPNMLIFTCW